MNTESLPPERWRAIISLAMDHERWMREALREAQQALEEGDIPVGAVAVRDGRVIGRGHNQREALHDPTAHAEMLALRQAGRQLGGWRLPGVTLYVTLEPCPMCAGAMVNARIERLVFGLRDHKSGAAGSVYDIVRSPRLNHRLEVYAGILGAEVEALMRRFFEILREDRAQKK